MEPPPPDHRLHDKVTLAELLGALSYALDLTEGQPAGHCVRCSHIGVEIGREIGLGEQEITELYYALLLKDLGCSSNAARICELYLTDDLSFKQDFKLIDGSLSQALRFVLSHTGLKAGLAERFRAIVNIFQNGGEIARELIETRCHRGADIARKMRFSDLVAEGIKNLDEHWDGSGKPLGLSGTVIPIYSRIALLAQVVDVFHIANGPEAALREARNRSGLWFDPDLVAAFERVAARPGFWDTGTDLGHECAISHAPAQASLPIDEDYLDDIAAAFAQVVDSKSPYTSGHSERVTLFTDMIAEELEFSAEQRRWLKRAALLHDIGKLGVSNAILDKPSKLDDAEWDIMRMHSAHSEAILSRIGAFRSLAPIAGAHHERLDGKGYPRGLAGDQISLETRMITTADIFDALTADRPYRAAMPVTKALGIMSEMVGTQIDANCFAALQRALGRVPGTLAA
ncbi:HD-GYP domain-containing protein [Bradyrhizobium amphicarpaeae]|uniref:HD-GYP domain-containing protein n=1 Tax=Bradyrhizobium amphicarpaeae TaxID=1404768 RepID=A0A2U8PS67_9BRAD|nr:HD-GYP domain-containing protein [Bradyrhizobium amphicarpaeae]AWM00629.1 HD-GYP domain-containing protein [Bradyrhizobium amphicarpaeae]